jgi:predicted RNase H-like nuclease
MLVAGVDGCRGGWVAFKVNLPDHATSVEVVDLSAWLRKRPPDLACVCIDIPIGLLEALRACDKAARKLLRQPRGSSVFPAPCRPALGAQTYAEASSINRLRTTRGLSQQAWGIALKIKQVDDVITPGCQQWAYEVHPEVCFLGAQSTPTDGAQQEGAGTQHWSLFNGTTFRTSVLSEAMDAKWRALLP